MTTVPPQQPPLQVRLPARRSAGLLQIVTLLPIGAAMALLGVMGIARRNFQVVMSFADVVDYSLAFVMGLMALCGGILALLGLRWLVFALWPSRMGLLWAHDGVTLALGPFGRQHFDLVRMEAAYRHERDPDDALLSTEDYMDPDTEMQCHLPLLLHPQANLPLNRLLERFIAGTEAEQLKQLRAPIDALRSAATTT